MSTFIGGNVSKSIFVLVMSLLGYFRDFQEFSICRTTVFTLWILDAQVMLCVLQTLWRVGDACRCIYSEDGEEYEAKITSMIDKKSCRVKYVGKFTRIIITHNFLISII